MRRFLLVTLEYPPFHGGIATYLGAFVRALPQDSVTVLAPEDENAREADMDAAAEIYRRDLLARFIRPRWLRAWYETERLWRRERQDMLVVSHVLPMGIVAWLMRRIHGLPYTVIVHGMDVALALEKGGLKRRVTAGILKGAAHVLANSSYTAGLVRALGAVPSHTWIARPSPSIAPSTFASADPVQAMRTALGFGEAFSLLSMGRLVRRKGFDDLIRAVAELAHEGRDVRLAVAGAGPDAGRLEALAADLGVRERVRFPGMIPDGDLATAYAACDAFAMTPRGEGHDVEGFGIVYLEANMMGKPAIGSRSGGVPEAVAHEVSGLLVAPGSVKEIAAAIRRLMDDRSLATRLGAQGRERALREFADGRQIRAAAERLAHDL